jgi:DNA-binding beta-propeller fold protein YncE
MHARSILPVSLGAIVASGLAAEAVSAQAPPYLTQWGTSGSGNGQFNGPAGMALDASGNVYVADLGNNRIQKFTGAGVYLTKWGTLGSMG